MTTQPTFSIVIPAYNEEDYLPHCLDAIDRAAAILGEPVEVIVADNVSRDHTPEIALERGARVVRVEVKCLSIIRNRGAAEATGKYLAFIDADNIMSANMLAEIKRVMDSGRYVGGGVARIHMDRTSVGMFFCGLALIPLVLGYRVSAVLFYTTPAAFQAVGGFDEQLYSLEDLDFGRRLKKHGKRLGLKYKNLWRASVIYSARKFDEYGDWFLVRHPFMYLNLVRHEHTAVYDFWYRARR